MKDIYEDVFQTEFKKKNTNVASRTFHFFGITSALKTFQTKQSLLEQEEKAYIAFVNKFNTCTLNEASQTDDERSC